MITTVVIVALVALLLLVAAINIARTAPGGRAIAERRHGGPRATGLPPGRVVYSDADGTARPLVARSYPLSGKPDYVVLTPDGSRVPVEVKSGRVGRAPRHEDVLQLTTYLLILEDLYGLPPRYGLLHYANRSFEVPYMPELRDEALAILDEMQSLDASSAADAPPGAPSPALCRVCAFRTVCDEAIV